MTTQRYGIQTRKWSKCVYRSERGADRAMDGAVGVCTGGRVVGTGGGGGAGEGVVGAGGTGVGAGEGVIGAGEGGVGAGEGGVDASEGKGGADTGVGVSVLTGAARGEGAGTGVGSGGGAVGVGSGGGVGADTGRGATGGEEAQPREWARALAKAQAAERAKVQAAERAEALARALAQARPAMLDAIPLLDQALTEALNEQGVTPFFPQAVQSQPPTYLEVVEVKRIIDSTLAIEPDYRPQLTRHLWGHSEYWWLIQILTPVTRLPLELLQTILSPIIDDASNPPLELMLVCKHWCTTVTGVRAPLKLGTRTPKDAMTSKLERIPSFLDVVVDTEIDRGDFTPSETAYEAIFAAIEAISRWRSLVVETFPALTDLPEHLVNLGLQRCSHASMSRLKTFKVLRVVAPPRPSLADSWHHSQSAAYHSGNKLSKCHIIPCSCVSPHLSFRQSPHPPYFGDTRSSRPSPSPTSTGRTYCLSSLSSHICRSH